MTRRARLASLLPLFLLVLSWACSSGGVAPARRSSTDVDAEDEAPRRRSRQAQAVRPGEIPLLTLDGIAVPGQEADKPKAEAEQAAAGEDQGAGKEKDAVALPPRNLFAFEEDPAVVAERQKQAAEAAKKAEEAAKKAAEERAKREEELRLHPPPPQPPPVSFQYVGYFGPADSRIGVFAVPGSPGVFLSKAGDTVLEKFKIVDVGYESAEIGFVGFKDTKRIPLVGGGK